MTGCARERLPPSTTAPADHGRGGGGWACQGVPRDGRIAIPDGVCPYSFLAVAASRR